MQIFTAHL